MANGINFGLGRISKEITDFLGPNEPPREQRVRALVANAFSQQPRLHISQEKPSVIAGLSPKQVFQGLGKEWWMPFIDGYLHGHKNGKMVFDYPRDNHPAEPGFLESIYDAYRLASEYLEKFPTQPLTIEFYQQIHKAACAHFDGKATGTLITSKDTGKFLRGGECRGSFMKLFRKMSSSEIETIKKHSDLITLDKENPIEFTSNGDLLSELKLARETTDEISHLVQEKIKQLNADVAARSSQLGVPPVASFKLKEDSYPWTTVISYQCEEVETVVKLLFEQFSKAIGQAQSNDDIDEAIANLFQMLEWVHPFRDGQGRTDLVLLATLLCKYGRNPAILDYPYYSSYHSLKEWVKYLQEGMAKWQTKYANPSKVGMISVKHLPLATNQRPSSTQMNAVVLNQRTPMHLRLKDSLFSN